MWVTLRDDAGVSAIVGGRVWPVVAEGGTGGTPYVWFEVSSGPSEYTKDGLAGDQHTVIVGCVAKQYEDAADLAQAVREALELNRAEYPDDHYRVTECEFENADDDWKDGIGYEITVTMSLATESID